MAAITSAVIGAGTAIYASKKAKKQAQQQQALAQQGIDAADPFAKYRPGYAQQLDQLMRDPSSITNTPEYKARLEAAARTMASQGYAGSGNAILEAANAGGAAFQQAYDRLANLSGAGVQPGGGYGQALQANQMSNEQRLSGYAGIANNLGSLGSTIQKKFNVASAPKTTISKSPMTVNKTFIK